MTDGIVDLYDEKMKEKESGVNVCEYCIGRYVDLFPDIHHLIHVNERWKNEENEYPCVVCLNICNCIKKSSYQDELVGILSRKIEEERRNNLSIFRCIISLPLSVQLRDLYFFLFLMKRQDKKFDKRLLNLTHYLQGVTSIKHLIRGQFIDSVSSRLELIHSNNAAFAIRLRIEGKKLSYSELFSYYLHRPLTLYNDGEDDDENLYLDEDEFILKFYLTNLKSSTINNLYSKLSLNTFSSFTECLFQRLKNKDDSSHDDNPIDEFLTTFSPFFHLNETILKKSSESSSKPFPMAPPIECSMFMECFHDSITFVGRYRKYSRMFFQTPWLDTDQTPLTTTNRFEQTFNLPKNSRKRKHEKNKSLKIFHTNWKQIKWMDEMKKKNYFDEINKKSIEETYSNILRNFVKKTKECLKEEKLNISRFQPKSTVLDCIEYEVGVPLANCFNCSSFIFQASGREDRDVRMLGNGRPFTIELLDPCTFPSINEWKQSDNNLWNSSLQFRKELFDIHSTSDQFMFPMKELEGMINENKTTMDIHQFHLTSKFFASAKMRIGESDKNKRYSALVYIPSTTIIHHDQMKKRLDEIIQMKQMTIIQSTPLRVCHRRSLLDRKKTVQINSYNFNKQFILSHMSKEEKEEKTIISLLNDNRLFSISLTTEAGTYVKEFIHGDMNRTIPNLSRLLSIDQLDIVTLDVEEPTITLVIGDGGFDLTTKFESMENYRKVYDDISPLEMESRPLTPSNLEIPFTSDINLTYDFRELPHVHCVENEGTNLIGKRSQLLRIYHNHLTNQLILEMCRKKRLSTLQVPIDQILRISKLTKEMFSILKMTWIRKSCRKKPIRCQFKLRDLTINSLDHDICENIERFVQNKLSLLNRPKKLLIICNPKSGNRSGKNVLKKSMKHFQNFQIIVESILTEYRGFISRYLTDNQDRLETFDGIIIIGGDGTYSELINSLEDLQLMGRFPIGIIPSGSTDATISSIHGTNDFLHSILQIVLGNQIEVDVFQVREFNATTNENDNCQLATNSVTYGFFGDTCYFSEKKFKFFRKFRYTLAGIRVMLFNRHAYNVRLVADTVDEDIFDEEDRCVTGFLKEMIEKFFEKYRKNICPISLDERKMVVVDMMIDNNRNPNKKNWLSNK
ncbi:hypothetical protein SNEBB_000959 [Seison nebaliae]|nr:hypothetical protein SNEBB_000959 [Seison nebaliae]